MSVVLEVGAGGFPAIREPGSLLLDPDTVYKAVDAWPERIQTYWKNTEASDNYLANLAYTNGAELPFPDQSVGHVIMRCVFGEYTMRREATGTNLDNTQAVIYDAFRVLEDDGHVAIAEENTPRHPAVAGRIGRLMMDAGFEDIRVYPCQSMENPHWFAERDKYWGISDDEYRLGPLRIYQDIAYLVRGTRPQVGTETFTMEISLPDKWRANMQRGWGHPDNEEWSKEATFQKSTRVLEHEYDPKHPYERYRPITVVTKDGELDLATYFEKVEARELPLYFALES